MPSVIDMNHYLFCRPYRKVLSKKERPGEGYRAIARFLRAEYSLSADHCTVRRLLKVFLPKKRLRFRG